MVASSMLAYEVCSMFYDRGTSLSAMMVFMFFALNRTVIDGGNMTEEYALLFQMISVYLVARHIKFGTWPESHMFIHGVCAGIAFFLRANMIFMWGAIALLAGYELLSRKDYRLFFKNLAAGLLGVMAALVPVLLYLVMNDAVSDGIFAMFTLNFMYTNLPKASLWVFIGRIFTAILNYHQIILIAGLVVSSFIAFKYTKSLRLYYFAMLFLSLLCVSLSGRKYGHYWIYLLPFCLSFACECAVYARRRYKHFAVWVFLATLFFGLTPTYTIRNALGREPSKRSILMTGYIKCNEAYHSENERLLVTRNGARFYNELGVIPSEKYFYIPAVSYEIFPDPIDSHINSIISGVNDVIIVSYQKGSKDIYPQAGRDEEIKDVLERLYDLLYFDEKNNIAMYGLKR